MRIITFIGSESDYARKQRAIEEQKKREEKSYRHFQIGMVIFIYALCVVAVWAQTI